MKSGDPGMVVRKSPVEYKIKYKIKLDSTMLASDCCEPVIEFSR
ncbi:hypothetical protein Acr_01g0004160 [Actinidia rufa]|uniref:Uncharacterized protein n=1 Tax=Actinidia rufa TaxID=165716 RepID=A0A7J0E4M1_9ERIC|nr:hypothetical protein Acr_01g0004160 [Actinidia rufa]